MPVRPSLWLLSLLTGLGPLALAALPPEPIASYNIQVRLSPEGKTVDGTALMLWRNASTDTLRELQLHLYMNAFKNERSTFFLESQGQLRGDRSGPDNWGYIDLHELRMPDGRDLRKNARFIAPDDGNPDDETVLQVPLPEPLAPGQTIRLQARFTTKFPRVFARAGYRGDFFLAGQWFPKMAVYEPAGERRAPAGRWNCHQYHANSEFYADFGRYDVSLTVPSRFVVGATGVQQSRLDHSDGTSTYRFVQDNVHDFAWTAQPGYVRLVQRFRAEQETSRQELAAAALRVQAKPEELRLSDVEMILLLQPEHAAQAERHFAALRHAIKWFGLWYGRYPYATITVVDPPYGASGAGGMEYPTFVTGGTRWLAPAGEIDPEQVVIHEFGHQYWQGMVASNEAEEPWMDEGFNTYSTGWLMDRVYGPLHLPLRLWRLPLQWFLPVPSVTALSFDRGISVASAVKADDLARTSWLYESDLSYGVNAYMRTGTVLRTMERHLGEDNMARLMRDYFQRWQYRHPTAQDFIDVADRSGKDLHWFFDQFVFGSNVADYAVGPVTSEKMTSGAGVFDRNGKRETVTEEQDERGRKNSRMYRSTVTIRRLGEAVFPVTVQIKFGQGDAVWQEWDGRYRWVRYTFERERPVTSVEIDPGRKVLLDVNWTNNSYRREPSSGTTLKWSSALLFWAQNLLQGISALV